MAQKEKNMLLHVLMAEILHHLWWVHVNNKIHDPSTFSTGLKRPRKQKYTFTITSKKHFVSRTTSICWCHSGPFHGTSWQVHFLTEGGPAKNGVDSLTTCTCEWCEWHNKIFQMGSYWYDGWFTMDDPSRTWPSRLQSFCESLLDCLAWLRMFVCLLFETIEFNSSQIIPAWFGCYFLYINCT